MHTTTDATSIRTLATDPQYFGSYLNMARHNVFIIHNYLAEKFDKTVLDDDAKITGCFLTQKLQHKANYIYSILSNQLPITKVFNTALLPSTEKAENDFEQESINFETLANAVKDLFKTLNELRNEHTHYYAKSFEQTGIVRNITITEDLANFLTINFKRAIHYTQKRFEAVFVPNDFVHLEQYPLVNSQNELTTNGLVFFTCLFLERENAFHFLSKIKGFKSTQDKAKLATREVFCAYCVNLPKDKLISDNPEQALALDMLSYLNRCPNELFKVLHPDAKKEFQPDLAQTAKMNMAANSTADELPYEDYEAYIESITSQRRHTDRFPYFALQYLDNSPTFTPEFQLNLGKAILKSYPKQLLNETVVRDVVEHIKVFGKLKDYQINSTDDAAITNLLKAKIKLHNDVKFTQYAPHYHLTDAHKIAITTAKREQNYGSHTTKVATAQLSEHELPKLALLELLEKGKAAQLINDFIAKNDTQILNLEFINSLKNKLAFAPINRKFYNNKINTYDNEVLANLNRELDYVNAELERGNLTERELQVLKQDKTSIYYWKYVAEINTRKQKLEEELNIVELSVRQLPSKIVDYCLNVNSNSAAIKFKSFIKEEIKDAKYRIKQLENGRSPKVGEMATYIAKDILNYVIDKDVKKKITSFYYDKLQECIALFADVEKKDTFLKICEKELQLFDTKKGHPFLKELNFTTIHKTWQFYKEYILAKAAKVKVESYFNHRENKQKKKESPDSWIHHTFYKIQKNAQTNKNETVIVIPADTPIPYSIKKMSQEEPTLEQWLQHVKIGTKQTEKDNPKQKPIDLPTNLFDEALAAILKEKCGIAKTDTKKYNFSKLLAVWLQDTQPYYNYKRLYTVYEGKPYETKVQFTPNTKQTFKEYFDNKIAPCVDAQNIERKKENEKTKNKKQPLDYFDVLKVFNNEITENEKVIRFYQAKDGVLLLLLKEFYDVNQSMELRLVEMHPNAINSPLQKMIALQQIVTGKLYYDANGNKDTSSSRRAISKTIIATDRKRKDYGLFKKYVTDKRLPELFEYIDEQSISLDKLVAELKDYTVYKDLVFDSIYALEKAVIAKTTQAEREMHLFGEDMNNIQHLPYLNWLKDTKQLINIGEYNFLNAVRNAMSHSQFPPKVLVLPYLTITTEKTIMEQVYTVYHKMINEVIEKIQNS